ncbi:MAG: hypothetical protein IIC71_14470 [Acidobacteria bacterium]|nr:hypothetical protein [Acidobacteriota bacterium]
MKELVSLIDITEDSDIEAVIDQLMDEQEQFIAANAEAIAEDTTGGVEQDEDSTGSQSTAEGETR